MKTCLKRLEAGQRFRFCGPEDEDTSNPETIFMLVELHPLLRIRDEETGEDMKWGYISLSGFDLGTFYANDTNIQVEIVDGPFTINR